MSEFDVFLCHNSRDKPQVQQLAGALKARGLKPWLDRHDLRAGDSWADVIARAMPASKTAAIFFSTAVGDVQKWEIKQARRLQAEGRLDVIPVKLPGCTDASIIPDDLWGSHAVDFTANSDDDPLFRLIEGICGSFDVPDIPTVVVPPAVSVGRSKLIQYLHSDRLLVPRAGLYPSDPDQAAAAISEDLDYADLIVQLDRDSEVQAVSDYRPRKRVVRGWRKGTSRVDFHKDIARRARASFASTQQARVVTQKEERHNSFRVLVKYAGPDSEPTAEIIQVLEAENICCYASENGLSPKARPDSAAPHASDETPFD